MCSYALLRIAKHVANPRPTTENVNGFKVYLDKHLHEFKAQYDLSIIPRKTLVLGENDLRLIIESVIGSCDTNYDIAIQDALIHLIYFFTGTRPGALFPAPSGGSRYFLPWKNARDSAAHLPQSSLRVCHTAASAQ
jgi:hypothetical protein